jgi:hypothetical protein
MRLISVQRRGAFSLYWDSNAIALTGMSCTLYNPYRKVVDCQYRTIHA